MNTEKPLSLGTVLSVGLFVGCTFICHLLTEVYCHRLIGLFQGQPRLQVGGAGFLLLPVVACIFRPVSGLPLGRSRLTVFCGGRFVEPLFRGGASGEVDAAGGQGLVAGVQNGAVVMDLFWAQLHISTHLLR